MNQSNVTSTRRIQNPSWIQFALFLALFALSEVWGNDAGLAQLAPPITPSGLGTQVDLSYTTPEGRAQYDITGGTRVGTNLFHSFGNFNVPQNTIANFLNDANLPTSNILGRVTGGNESMIFGAIQTTGFGNANLFLMNPAGIVFGPHASLHVGGSVAFTTADYLRLAHPDGVNIGTFHADATATSILTTASVSAFGFLGENPAAITVQGSTLTVQPTQSISLIGGNIAIQSGTLSFAPTAHPSAQPTETVGQINLTSVASPGEIIAGTLKPDSNINGQSVTKLGVIQLTENSRIDTGNAGSSSIRIRGGHLIIDSSQLSSTTGAIAIDATSIHITNASEVTTETTTGTHAGDIILHAQKDIVLDSGSLILSSSQDSSGDAGDITLQSHQGNITLSGFSVVATQTMNSSGNTGSITMNALRGDIHANDSYVYTSAQGTGRLGGIQIRTNNLLLDNNASILGNNFTTSPFAEPITITTTGRLRLSGGAIIETGTGGPANAADLVIRSPRLVLTEHSRLITSTTSSGNAGRLNLFTDHLQLTDGAKLSSRSLVNVTTGEIPVGRGGTIRIEGLKNPGASVRIDGESSGIFTDAHGTGAAGDIFIAATALTVQNGGTISAQTTGTSQSATGGSISIRATDHVSLSNHASITASSHGTTAGDAGTITLKAGRHLELRDRSSITTSTESAHANGGHIDIRAIDRVKLVNSEISTSVKGAEGSGGNIFIDPKIVVLQGSTVVAQAVGGTGGNITFVTPLFLADSASLVSASSARGPQGTVTIQSPTSNLSETVGQLVSRIHQAPTLYQSRCVATAHGGQSTFTVAKRDTLATEPAGWLRSPILIEHGSAANTLPLVTMGLGQDEPPLATVQPPTTEILSLRRLTPPHFLVRSFAADGSSGCGS